MTAPIQFRMERANSIEPVWPEAFDEDLVAAELVECSGSPTRSGDDPVRIAAPTGRFSMLVRAPGQRGTRRMPLVDASSKSVQCDRSCGSPMDVLNGTLMLT